MAHDDTPPRTPVLEADFGGPVRGYDRWTAFLWYEYDNGQQSAEEIDFDALPTSTRAEREQWVQEFAEGGYEGGWKRITYEKRFGLYM